MLITSSGSASQSRDEESTSAASNVTVPVGRSPQMSRPFWLTGDLRPVAASCLPIRGDQRRLDISVLSFGPVRTPTVARARVKPTSGGGRGDVGPVLASSANTGSSLLHIEHVAPTS